MGSKDKIALEIIKCIPKATHFYDLFGGGFSITHAMLLKRPKDFEHFHFNEIRPGICELIKDSIDGKYSYDVFKPEFISRAMFFEKLDKDTYVKMIWSFGNDGKTYLFGPDIEPYKKSMHNAIVFNEFDELAKKTLGMDKFKKGFSVKDKRLFLRNKIDQYRVKKVPEFLWKFLDEKSLEIVRKNKNPKHLGRLQQLQQLEQLERLQKLERLERLQKLERINFYSNSYEKVPILDDSIIYCDPPYVGTADYGNKFDHKKFYDWAAENKNPVFISEYTMPDKRLKAVFSIKKRSLLSSDKNLKIKHEKIFVNKAALKILL